MTPAEAHSLGFKKAQHIAKYLLTYVGIDPGSAGEVDPARVWLDYGARSAYWLVTDIWRIRRQA
jgi:hypothetical protein